MTIDKRIPEGQIKWLIARNHVSDSDDVIAHEITSRVSKTHPADLVPLMVDFAIQCHRDNQRLFKHVMGNV
tara:strand:- start:149 stop:361 length:213 start_codon:yes stop_codon:yes gene_type:complete